MYVYPFADKFCMHHSYVLFAGELGLYLYATNCWTGFASFLYICIHAPVVGFSFFVFVCVCACVCVCVCVRVILL